MIIKLLFLEVSEFTQTYTQNRRKCPNNDTNSHILFVTSLVYVLPSDLVAELPFILMHPKPEEEDPSTLVYVDPPKRGDRKSIAAGAGGSSGTGGSGGTATNEEDASHNLIQLDG